MILSFNNEYISKSAKKSEGKNELVCNLCFGGCLVIANMMMVSLPTQQSSTNGLWRYRGLA